MFRLIKMGMLLSFPFIYYCASSQTQGCAYQLSLCLIQNCKVEQNTQQERCSKLKQEKPQKECMSRVTGLHLLLVLQGMASLPQRAPPSPPRPVECGSHPLFLAKAEHTISDLP